MTSNSRLTLRVQWFSGRVSHCRSKCLWLRSSTDSDSILLPGGAEGLHGTPTRRTAVAVLEPGQLSKALLVSAHSDGHYLIVNMHPDKVLSDPFAMQSRVTRCTGETSSGQIFSSTLSPYPLIADSIIQFSDTLD